MMKRPEILRLISCTVLLADAIGQERPPEDIARTFLTELLHMPQSEGGKDVWGCLVAGLISEIEVRNLIMAHCSTWLSHLNGCEEPGTHTYDSVKVSAAYELALFGRPARPAPGVDL